MIIRILEHDDMKSASDLLWKSFYEAEKNSTDMNGMENFRNLCDPISLEINSFDGFLELYGLFIDDNLIGVSALKEKKHLSMLYIHPDFWNMGYGRILLDFTLSKSDECEITTNSSDFGIDFYKKYGFVPTEKRKSEEGINFTPMLYVR